MNERLKELGDMEVPDCSKQSGVASRCQPKEELCKWTKKRDMDSGMVSGLMPSLFLITQLVKAQLFMLMDSVDNLK